MLAEPEHQWKSNSNYCPFNCGMKFKNRAYVIIHTRIHTGSRPYKCTFEGCTKRFITNGNLKSHMDYHIGKKEFRCDYKDCTKAFTQMSKLKEHGQLHLGRKPFNCTFQGCSKSFNYKWNLKSHLAKHSGIKPYLCYVKNCNKSYYSSNELRIHLGCHSMTKEKFYCPFCDITFTRYKTLKMHLETHKNSQSTLNVLESQKDSSSTLISIPKAETTAIEQMEAPTYKSNPIVKSRGRIRFETLRQIKIKVEKKHKKMSSNRARKELSKMLKLKIGTSNQTTPKFKDKSLPSNESFNIIESSFTEDYFFKLRELESFSKQASKDYFMAFKPFLELFDS